MSSRSQSLWAALIALGAALARSEDVARAQDASRAVGGDYRLRVVEPTEGLGLTGSTLRVTVALDATPRVGGGAPASRATPVPPPQVEVFVDGTSQGVLPRDQQTLVVQGLATGPHTLFVSATDSSGTIVDRKEVHFTVLPPPPG